MAIGELQNSKVISADCVALAISHQSWLWLQVEETALFVCLFVHRQTDRLQTGWLSLSLLTHYSPCPASLCQHYVLQSCTVVCWFTHLYTGLDRCTATGVLRCGQVCTGVDRCTQVYSSVDMCTQVWTGVLRFGQVYTGVLRCRQVCSSVDRCVFVCRRWWAECSAVSVNEACLSVGCGECLHVYSGVYRCVCV